MQGRGSATGYGTGYRSATSRRKKEYYGNSILRVQRDLEEWEAWNESSIQARGAAIIDFALERWRIDPTAGPEAKAGQTSG